MRFGKGFIGLFTAALLLAAVLFGTNEYAWDGSIGITAEIEVSSGVETVFCWRQSHEEAVLFLPSYARRTRITLASNTPAEVFLEGMPLESVAVQELPLDVPLTLEYHWRGECYEYHLTVMQSRNLPTLHLDTASGTMAAIHEKRGNSEPGELRLYAESGTLDYSGKLESVKGRGNSTWKEEKKPYNLTLSGEGDLLGMGAAKRWILLANAKDFTNLRNKIVYDFAREVGMPYSPECEWVELYLNGEYAGLYLLSERNEVDEERVAISREDSFLVTKDWPWRFQENGNPYFQTNANVALRILHCGMEQEKMETIVQQAENAILAEDGIDPVSGKHWQELLDVDSWARKYLIEEVFANTDGGILSQCFYYDGTAGGIICAGPVWDYDLIAGGGIASQFYTDRVDAYGSPWYAALYRQTLFRDRVTELYEQEFLPLWRTYRNQRIPAYRNQIRKAASMNELRWSIGNMDWEGEQLLDYMDRREAFLNDLWINRETYIFVDVAREGLVSERYALRPGETLPELPAYEDTATRNYLGWFETADGQPFDVTQPVYQDVQIEQRYEELAPTAEPTEESLPAGQFVWAGLMCVLFAGVCAVDVRRVRRKKHRDTVKNRQ